MTHDPILESEAGEETIHIKGFGSVENFLSRATKEFPRLFDSHYLQMACKMKHFEDEGCDPLVVFKIWKKRLLVETYKKVLDKYPAARDEALEKVLQSFETTYKMYGEYEKKHKSTTKAV